MKQVDAHEAAEEVHVRALAAVGVVGVAYFSEEMRHGIDGDRVPAVESGLRDEHRQRALTGADVAREPHSLSIAQVAVDVIDEPPNLPDHIGTEVRDRRSIE